MTAIHQLVAGYTRGDAISNESRVLQALFRSWGCRSEIYCETKRILPELRKEARDLDAFREADAAAKPFETNYYTAGIHKGALATPPMLVKALAE